METQDKDKIHKTTVTECLSSLKDEGFHLQFVVKGDSISDQDGIQTFKPNQIKIDNFYRFEGESNPGDEEVLYALITDNGLKGTLTYAYGPTISEDNQEASNFMKKVRMYQGEHPKMN